MPIRIKTVTITWIIILCMINSGIGQGFDASSLSLAGAYGAIARGIDAMNWNAANLALNRSNFFELNLIGANFRVGNSSLSIDNYKRYFTESGHHGEWSDADKDEILNLIPTNGLDVNMDLSANVFGMAFGNVGFSLEVLGKGIGIFPKEAAELFLQGNLRDEYRFENVDVDGFSAIKVSLAGAYPLTFKRYFDELAIGAGFNYYRGLYMIEVLDVNGVFYTGDEYIESFMELEGRKAEGGTGFSFDLGVAGVVKDRLTLSLALRNVLGNISWNQNTEAIFLSFEADSIKLDNLEDIDPNTSDTTYSIDAFKSRIPFVLHLGSSYLLKDNILLSLDLEQAFANRLGFTDQAELALGIQYSPIAQIPLRAGMSFGGKWGYRFGTGFGLHFGFFNLDLAYSIHRALWPTYSRGFSTAINIKFLL